MTSASWEWITSAFRQSRVDALILLSRNPPAAHHQIILIKNGCLAWRNSTLRRMQFYLHRPVFSRRQRRRRPGMVVTDFRHYLNWPLQLLKRMPVATFGCKFIAV